jgi:hypothetical protein
LIEQNGLDTKAYLYSAAGFLYKADSNNNLPKNLFFDDDLNRINYINNIINPGVSDWVKGIYPYMWDGDLGKWVLDVDPVLNTDSTIWVIPSEKSGQSVKPNYTI